MKDTLNSRAWVIIFLGVALWNFLGVLTVVLASPQVRPDRPILQPAWLWWTPRTLLLGVGDSLTQGTRDATNNKYNTENAYLQKIAQKLGCSLSLKFVQPYLDENGNRINPLAIPTNLAVDGEDIFSLDGLEYGKRVGASTNYPSDEYYCDRLQPYLFADMHDKVLYPINLLAGKKVSQLDSLIWHLNNHSGPIWVVFWVGNNDAALSTLGLGGKNPQYLPIPFDQIKDKLKPLISYLLEFGRSKGAIAFDPYTPDHIQNNLTTDSDFSRQFNQVLNKINLNRTNVKFFFLTYPYYPEVGYLMDCQDLNFYLSKFGYSIGNCENSSWSGRVSLLTFMSMYALLKSGLSGRLSEILSTDGLILDDGERLTIESRIDKFNSYVEAINSRPNVHIIRTGEILNEAFSSGLVVNGKKLTRNWGRGSSFSLDGVHVSHTVHAYIANIVLEEMKKLNSSIGTYDLASILPNDPYVDWDGDGWVAGPDYKASGRTKILFLFKDYQEGNAVPGAIIDQMSADDVWSLISDALLEEIIDIPIIRTEAERIGLVPVR